MLAIQTFTCTVKRIVLFAIWSATVCAQVDTGTISGLITDSTGGIIPAAEVALTQTDTNVRVAVTANQTGFYSFPGLHPARYSISVSKSGFQTQNKTGIELRVQDRLEVNFGLALGSTSTELTVTAAQPLLESETSSLGQVIEQKTIVDLPLNGPKVYPASDLDGRNAAFHAHSGTG